jgi:predicted P-loop ATPase
MAETLGSLCDKLTIVKLKYWHTEDEDRRRNLSRQEKQLQDEIDEFLSAAMAGQISVERLTFASNKVYKKEGNTLRDFQGSVGTIFSMLADVNCRLWHVQENVYDFEKIPIEQKDAVVKQLAVLNLERTTCIDKIDERVRVLLETKNAGG